MSAVLSCEQDGGHNEGRNKNHSFLPKGAPVTRPTVFNPSEMASESSDDEFDMYNIDLAIEAWDQIGDLTREITSSVMAKQASLLCRRCRRQKDIEEEETPGRLLKRRKLDSPIDETLKTPPVVTSDEESSSSVLGEGLPESLASDVDRMGRMSKLIMEIEFCQAQLKREMLSMNVDL